MTEGKRQRMILAGRYMIGDGLSLKQALIKAGYSEQTARCPGSHGLSAEACHRALRESDCKAIPATIREDSRKLLRDAIRKADPKKTSLASVARTAEIVERWFGEGRRVGESHSDGPVEFVDKIEWLREVLREVDRRKKNPAIEVPCVQENDTPRPVQRPQHPAQAQPPIRRLGEARQSDT